MFDIIQSYSGSGRLPFKGWARRDHLTIGAYRALSNVPLIIDETVVGANFFTTVLNGGGDIRITTDAQGYNRLAIEVVTCNTGTSKLEIWVNVPATSDVTDTPIYIWYGKAGESQPAANAAFGSESVWPAAFLAVYHMNQSSGNILDSTSNGNNGTVNGTMPNLVAGKIGDCQDFNGSSDDFDVNINNRNNATIMFWFDADALSGAKGLVSNQGSANGAIHYRNNGSAHEINVQGTGGVVSTGGILVTDTWYHSAATYKMNDANGAELWFDGVSQGTAATPNAQFQGSTISVGGEVGSRFFDGQIDEIHILNVVKTDEWIEMMYFNQNDVSDLFTLIGTV